jgi:hypothetical protein
MKTISIIFLTEVAFIILMQILKDLENDEFSAQVYFGYTCAVLWCINATWF